MIMKQRTQFNQQNRMNGQEIKSQTSAKQTNTRAQPNQTNRRPKKTDRRLHATTRHPRSISQERMKAKKVNTPYRPYFQGYPSQNNFFRSLPDLEIPEACRNSQSFEAYSVRVDSLSESLHFFPSSTKTSTQRAW